MTVPKSAHGLLHRHLGLSSCQRAWLGQRPKSREELGVFRKQVQSGSVSLLFGEEGTAHASLICHLGAQLDLCSHQHPTFHPLLPLLIS